MKFNDYRGRPAALKYNVPPWRTFKWAETKMHSEKPDKGVDAKELTQHLINMNVIMWNIYCRDNIQHKNIKHSWHSLDIFSAKAWRKHICLFKKLIQRLFTTVTASLLAKAWDPFSSPLAAPSPFLVLPWGPAPLPLLAACCCCCCCCCWAHQSLQDPSRSSSNSPSLAG